MLCFKYTKFVYSTGCLATVPCNRSVQFDAKTIIFQNIRIFIVWFTTVVFYCWICSLVKPFLNNYAFYLLIAKEKYYSLFKKRCDHVFYCTGVVFMQVADMVFWSCKRATHVIHRNRRHWSAQVMATAEAVAM